MTGIQSGPSDSRISGLEEQVRLLTEQLKENKINATYDPNSPRDKKNFTRFCNYCMKSGHIKFCFKTKNGEDLEEKEKKKTDQFRDEYRKRSYSRERKDRERPRSSSYNGPRDRRHSYDRTHERQRNKKIPNEIVCTIVERVIVVTGLVQIMKIAAEIGLLTGIQPDTEA